MTSSVSSVVASLLAFFGLASAPVATYQGYIEAEYVLVAPQLGGLVEHLAVTRGQDVQKGTLLCALERGAETAAVARAEADAEQKAALLADLLKSKRQPELDALVAQRDRMAASFQLAKITFERNEKLLQTKAISQADLDLSRATLDQSRAQLEEAEAALAAGRLSTGRDDAIRAAEAALNAANAARAEAQWRLDQRRIEAPGKAFVFDTLARPGEYIKAGQPVVSLLPLENIKVRFFVPGSALGKLRKDQPVQIACGGCDKPLPARITYISPKAEYTPPQLFNRDNREKLITMIEATPDTPTDRLHPGQPADVLVPAADTP